MINKILARKLLADACRFNRSKAVFMYLANQILCLNYYFLMNFYIFAKLITL